MALSKVWISLFLIVFAVAGLIPGSVLAADDSESKEFVVTLDASNFTEFVLKNKFIVVEFYAPWYGHKKLAPEYEKAASVLSTSDPPVVLAKVDANEEKNKAIASEYEIRGFPTLKILRYGGSVVQEYKGPRDAGGIVEYLKKQSGPASFEIKSIEDVSSVIDSNKILVVGIFPEFSGEKFENFTTLAEKLRADYEFGHTLDAKLLPCGDSSASGPLVRLLKPFDELFIDFQEFDVDALVKFVEETSTPTVTLFDKDPKHHPFVITFLNSPGAKISRSPVFRPILENEMEEILGGKIKISDVSYDTLRAFVNYLYTADVCLIEDMACDLLVLTEKYQVKHPKTDCEKYLMSKLNWENSLPYYAFAHQHGAKSLLDAALSLIMDNMDKLSKREDYMELVEKDPRAVLEIYEIYHAKQVNTAASKDSTAKIENKAHRSRRMLSWAFMF